MKLAGAMRPRLPQEIIARAVEDLRAVVKTLRYFRPNHVGHATVAGRDGNPDRCEIRHSDLTKTTPDPVGIEPNPISSVIIPGRRSEEYLTRARQEAHIIFHDQHRTLLGFGDAFPGGAVGKETADLTQSQGRAPMTGAEASFAFIADSGRPNGRHMYRLQPQLPDPLETTLITRRTKLADEVYAQGAVG